MAPLSFVASFLCSAQHCRFAPVSVAPPSFLASRVIAHPTGKPNDIFEKLCSALNLCWLEKKKTDRFRMISHKRSWLLRLIGSLPLFLQIFSLPCGDVLLLRAVCVTLSTPVSDRQLRFAGGPPSKLLSS